nr:MAG TPA: hypothetical protein [Caudoviricetes sp.]
MCDDENSDFSLKNFSEKNSENITQTGHEEISQSSADSTKLKFEQSSEAEKLVRKTSVASKTTELDEKKAKMLAFLKNTVGCDKFKDYSEWQEAGRFLRLAEKLGKEQFLYRLEKILEDPFKAKNSNKLAYLRKEIEAFIHSPIIPKTEKFSV